VILDVIRALGRRWYVLLVGLLLTAGLAYGAYSVTPPDYTARGLVLLLPSEASVGNGGNPFLSLSGLEQPASIVAAYFSSTTARDDISKQAPNAEFEVAIDDSTRGPVLAVAVTDKTPSETLATLNYITDQIPLQLRQLQQEVNAPTEAMITSMPLVIDDSVEANRAGTIRMVIAAAVLGLVITGIATFTLDGMLLSRRGRRGRRGNRGGTALPASERPAAPQKQRSDNGGHRTRSAPTPTVDVDKLHRVEPVPVTLSTASTVIGHES
jgi:hypothetical protein